MSPSSRIFSAAARSSAKYGVSTPFSRRSVFVSDAGSSASTAPTSVRAAGLSAGATASSRSATTASAPESNAFRSFASSLPGAKRRDRMWARRDVLDSLAKVRHKRKPGSRQGGRGVKAVRFHEFGGADVLQLGEGEG